MVDNSTWAGMIAMNLQMHIYCSHCDRHVEVDMSKFPPEEKAIGTTFRCSDCGRLGATTVSHRSANRSYPGAKLVKKPENNARL